jgi:hypothetical protein
MCDEASNFAPVVTKHPEWQVPACYVLSQVLASEQLDHPQIRAR